MSAWRRVALEKLPQCRELIEHAKNLYTLWIELRGQFERAHREPADEEFIRAVYEYAAWCLDQPRHDVQYDAPTAVLNCFYKHLGNHPPVREAMPRYLGISEFQVALGALLYWLSPEEYEALAAKFYPAKGARRG